MTRDDDAASTLERHLGHHTERWAIYDGVVRAAWLDARLESAEIEAARRVARILRIDGPTSLAGPMLAAGAYNELDQVENLSEGGRQALLATAAFVCAVDGAYTEQELHWLEGLRRSLTLTEAAAERLLEGCSTRAPAPPWASGCCRL
ncbi:MAG: hypothetical protein AAF938_27095 [Myxococcota bacterium]